MDEEMNCKKLAEFPVWLCKAMKAVQKRQIELLKPYGLANIHTNYLLALSHREEGMTLKELNEQLMVDKANTSRAIRSLEELEYVVRIYPKDKVLKYRVKLTDKGQDVADIIDIDMRQVHKILVSDLSDEERNTVRTVMRKIADAADNI